MIINLNTDRIGVKELEGIISSLQNELESRRASSASRRRTLTQEERIARMNKMDASRPGMVRIFDEDNETSFLVPFVQSRSYKLVKSYDLRVAARKKGICWISGLKEGQQAMIVPSVHSFNGDVLICGFDAMVDGGDGDYDHPRFAI